MLPIMRCRRRKFVFAIGGCCHKLSLQSSIEIRDSTLNCSTAQGGLCHEAWIRPVTQRNRSSATRLSSLSYPPPVLPHLVKLLGDTVLPTTSSVDAGRYRVVPDHLVVFGNGRRYARRCSRLAHARGSSNLSTEST